MPTDRTRVPGLLYLLNASTGAVSIVVFTQTFLVPGDAEATVRRILDGEGLYRWCVASDLLAQILFVLLGLSLHQVFRRDSPVQARLLVAFILASLPLAAVSLALQVAPLVLLHGSGMAQVSSWTLAALTLRSSTITLGSSFWGLWLLPLASAVLRSGWMPRGLGHLLMAAGVAYLAASFVYILLPSWRTAVGLVSLAVAAVGELSAIAWLLARGVPRMDRQAEG